MVGSLCGTFAVTFWGLLVDSIGFQFTFIVMLVIIALLIVLGLLSLAAGRKLVPEMEQS